MKNVTKFFAAVPCLLLPLFCGGCKTKPYAPAPKTVQVESIEVFLRDFEGRPDAYAIVKGQLSSMVAQLVDASQTREGRILHITVMEQTPRGAIAKPDLGRSASFEKRIPIDLMGLEAGRYTVEANGMSAILEIPEVFEITRQNPAQSVPQHKVKWKPAPLPAGTVKMMPPAQVNQAPGAAQQIANSVNAAAAADPFSSQNKALPPGMSASVSMTPPSPLRTGGKPKQKPGQQRELEPAPALEDIPTIEALLGSSNTVSTLSN